MLQFASILLLSVLLTTAAQPEPPAPGDEPQLLNAVINRPIDGDTLDASIDGVRTPVGLLGAIAPPLSAPCGQAAAARLAELAGGEVLLQPDPDYSSLLDPRRRRLFYAYTADGISIDETLVAEGLAHAAYPGAGHGQTLADLEQEAEANAQGCLWTNQPPA